VTFSSEDSRGHEGGLPVAIVEIPTLNGPKKKEVILLLLVKGVWGVMLTGLAVTPRKASTSPPWWVKEC